MGKIFDPLGNPVETQEFGNLSTGVINNKKVDPLGNVIEVEKSLGQNYRFNSSSRDPKKEGIIEKYIVDPITAGAAGVGEGAFKLVEGTLSLGTILVDLGVGTDLTRKVEKYFDDNKILQALEDKADDSWTGTVTSVLTQFGVPGGVALKAANGLIKMRNIGGKASFVSRRPNVTKALIAGGAETAAATSDMGTLGDLIGMGPTQTDDNDDINATGRDLALRRLKNKFKFGVEGALGFTLFDNVIFPVGKTLFKGSAPAFTGMLKHVGVNKNNIKFLEFDATKNANVLKEKSIDEGFQFNKNNILRWVDKNILSPFRARGNLPQDVFEANRTKINTLRKVAEKVRVETLDLEKAVQQAIDPKGGGVLNQLDKLGMRRREDLMETIYDFLTSGKMKSKINVKTGEKIPLTTKELQEAIKTTKIPPELLPYIQKIRNSIDEMSTSLSEMPGFTMKGGKEFQDVVAANIGEYMTRSYRLKGTKVERSQWLNTLRNTPEGNEIIERARTYIKNNNKNMSDDMVEEELESLLRETNETVIDDSIVNLTKYDTAIKQTRDQIPGELRELLGEVKDPIKQYMRTAAKINTYIADTNFFNTLLKKGKGKYFFEAPKQLRGETVTNVPAGEGGLEFGSTIVSDGPLNGFRTTPEISKALENISSSKKNADNLASLYYKVFLAPKAFTQEAKTTLSPITHARNVISAASFTGMNGNFFQNPLRFAEDFKRAYKLVTARSKSAIESDMGRKYFKNSDDYKNYVDEYMELQELGIINTSARLGEITQSLDEVSAGLQNLTEEGKIYTMLRGWGDKTGFNKLRGVARTAYQAEDDLYKIQNFYSEQRKFTNVYQKMYNSNQAKFIDDYADEIARVNPTLTREEALATMRTKEGFDRFIKLKAADTVKNNIPNYDYIGAFGQTLRRLPVGNFVSFPLEIIRTGINTTRQGLKEVLDPNTVGIGTTRLAGVATFGIGLGKGLQEGAQLVAGVSNEQLNALREYLPEWSKDSTLIPIKQGNQLYYIDFSHTNAYDILTQPLRSAMNGYDAARDQGQNTLQSFDDAAIRATSKFLSPFIEESIAFSFIGDVFLRGGETRDGRRLWNPEDSFGNKLAATATEALKTASPGSLPAFHRLYLSGIGKKDQYNRGYKFLNEATGLLGFRIQNPFVQDGINFKISDNKKAVADSKRLFTSVAYRADSTSAEIIDAYNKANEAKKRNDQTLFKSIEAARILGLSERDIRRTVGERYSATESNKLLRNRFTPIKISDFAYQTMRKNSIARDGSDVSRVIRRIATGIYNGLSRTPIFDNPDTLFENIINIVPSEPLTTRPKTADAAPLISSAPTVTTPIAPNVPSLGGTISPGDRSQLAKSGDIDITEALVNRG